MSLLVAENATSPRPLSEGKKRALPPLFSCFPPSQECPFPGGHRRSREVASATEAKEEEGQWTTTSSSLVLPAGDVALQTATTHTAWSLPQEGGAKACPHHIPLPTSSSCLRRMESREKQEEDMWGVVSWDNTWATHPFPKGCRFMSGGGAVHSLEQAAGASSPLSSSEMSKLKKEEKRLNKLKLQAAKEGAKGSSSGNNSNAGNKGVFFSFGGGKAGLQTPTPSTYYAQDIPKPLRRPQRPTIAIYADQNFFLSEGDEDEEEEEAPLDTTKTEPEKESEDEQHKKRSLGRNGEEERGDDGPAGTPIAVTLFAQKHEDPLGSTPSGLNGEATAAVTPAAAVEGRVTEFPKSFPRILPCSPAEGERSRSTVTASGGAETKKKKKETGAAGSEVPTTTSPLPTRVSNAKKLPARVPEGRAVKWNKSVGGASTTTTSAMDKTSTKGEAVGVAEEELAEAIGSGKAGRAASMPIVLSASYATHIAPIVPYGDHSLRRRIAEDVERCVENEERLKQSMPLSKAGQPLSRVDIVRMGIQRLKVRLKDLKLVIVRVKNDGNCQFRAISHQILGTEECHDIVRYHVVSYMKRVRKTQYDCYFSSVEAADAYFERLSKLGTWGDELTLRGASDSLFINIYVLSSQENNFVIVYRPRSDAPPAPAFLVDVVKTRKSMRKNLVRISPSSATAAAGSPSSPSIGMSSFTLAPLQASSLQQQQEYYNTFSDGAMQRTTTTTSTTTRSSSSGTTLLVPSTSGKWKASAVSGGGGNRGARVGPTAAASSYSSTVSPTRRPSPVAMVGAVKSSSASTCLLTPLPPPSSSGLPTHTIMGDEDEEGGGGTLSWQRRSPSLDGTSTSPFPARRPGLPSSSSGGGLVASPSLSSAASMQSGTTLETSLREEGGEEKKGGGGGGGGVGVGVGPSASSTKAGGRGVGRTQPTTTQSSDFASSTSAESRSEGRAGPLPLSSNTAESWGDVASPTRSPPPCLPSAPTAAFSGSTTTPTTTATPPIPSDAVGSPRPLPPPEASPSAEDTSTSKKKEEDEGREATEGRAMMMEEEKLLLDASLLQRRLQAKLSRSTLHSVQPYFVRLGGSVRVMPEWPSLSSSIPALSSHSSSLLEPCLDGDGGKGGGRGLMGPQKRPSEVLRHTRRDGVRSVLEGGDTLRDGVDVEGEEWMLGTTDPFAVEGGDDTRMGQEVTPRLGGGTTTSTSGGGVLGLASSSPSSAFPSLSTTPTGPISFPAGPTSIGGGLSCGASSYSSSLALGTSFPSSTVRMTTSLEVAAAAAAAAAAAGGELGSGVVAPPLFCSSGEGSVDKKKKKLFQRSDKKGAQGSAMSASAPTTQTSLLEGGGVGWPAPPGLQSFMNAGAEVERPDAEWNDSIYIVRPGVGGATTEGGGAGSSCTSVGGKNASTSVPFLRIPAPASHRFLHPMASSLPHFGSSSSSTTPETFAFESSGNNNSQKGLRAKKISPPSPLSSLRRSTTSVRATKGPGSRLEMGDGVGLAASAPDGGGLALSSSSVPTPPGAVLLKPQPLSSSITGKRRMILLEGPDSNNNNNNSSGGEKRGEEEAVALFQEPQDRMMDGEEELCTASVSMNFGVDLPPPPPPAIEDAFPVFPHVDGVEVTLIASRSPEATGGGLSSHTATPSLSILSSTSTTLHPASMIMQRKERKRNAAAAAEAAGSSGSVVGVVGETWEEEGGGDRRGRPLPRRMPLSEEGSGWNGAPSSTPPFASSLPSVSQSFPTFSPPPASASTPVPPLFQFEAHSTPIDVFLSYLYPVHYNALVPDDGHHPNDPSAWFAGRPTSSTTSTGNRSAPGASSTTTAAYDGRKEAGGKSSRLSKSVDTLWKGGASSLPIMGAAGVCGGLGYSPVSLAGVGSPRKTSKPPEEDEVEMPQSPTYVLAPFLKPSTSPSANPSFVMSYSQRSDEREEDGA